MIFFPRPFTSSTTHTSQQPSTSKSRMYLHFPRSKIIRQILASILLTAIVIALSFGITSHLILGEVDDHLPLENAPPQQISLTANFLDIDTTARTMTVDWYTDYDCDNSTQIFATNIFVDSNLLAAPSGTQLSDMASIAIPTTPIFRMNITEACSDEDNRARANSPVFRTILKLTGQPSASRSRQAGQANRDSLQAYPFDNYYFEVFMFATVASTNQSVGMNLEDSFGTPINFELSLRKDISFNNDRGLYLHFTVKRSTAVKSLVIIIVIANWLVTLAFLWVTVAAFVWDHEIVTEMFVVPIATLFAFTSVRANFPGAPSGFGAVVDYYGILPNLGLMTLSSAILLLRVLFRRVSGAARRARVQKDVEPSSNSPLTQKGVESTAGSPEPATAV
ncbi:hypothetical protein R3P38DRAFT_493444 [Favolaschia claudopus]|uniref:Transmembrane protein n=1 Tax=Favolaschia claudopus TaxID=2862362 RepID=A0AAW0CJ60_9AGAR